MLKRDTAVIMFIVLLLAALAVVSACGGDERDKPPEQVILEPGLTSDEPPAPTTVEPEVTPEAEPEAEEEFVDMGRATTLDGLMANKEKITSYYFEQNIQASYGDAFVRIWYADGCMKIISSFAGGEETTEYFDCANFILVSYTPSAGDFGRLMTFEAGDPDMPRNHLDNNYHNYRVTDTGTVDGQLCRILESRQGERLWVSTKYGFPLQVEYNDPTNDEHFIITYDNLTLNNLQYKDVAIPEDLLIIDY